MSLMRCLFRSWICEECISNAPTCRVGFFAFHLFEKNDMSKELYDVLISVLKMDSIDDVDMERVWREKIDPIVRKTDSTNLSTLILRYDRFISAFTKKFSQRFPYSKTDFASARFQPGLKQWHILCIQLGEICKQSGRLDECIRAYKRALLLKPGNGSIYNQLAIMSLEQGEFLRALYYDYRSAMVKTKYPQRVDCAELKERDVIVDHLLACAAGTALENSRFEIKNDQMFESVMIAISMLHDSPNECLLSLMARLSVLALEREQYHILCIIVAFLICNHSDRYQETFEDVLIQLSRLLKPPTSYRLDAPALPFEWALRGFRPLKELYGGLGRSLFLREGNPDFTDKEVETDLELALARLACLFGLLARRVEWLAILDGKFKYDPPPQVIVVDTNVLLGSVLDTFDAVLVAGKHVVCVPEVVLSEVESLAVDDTEQVHIRAGAALHFLKQRFGRYNKLLLLTRDDTYEQTLPKPKPNGMRRSYSGLISNDDMIIHGCMHVKSHHPQDIPSCKVLLVSDDVAVRVKARAQGVDTCTSVDLLLYI
jgi:tetratricopeptide (TPR) repeat protein